MTEFNIPEIIYNNFKVIIDETLNRVKWNNVTIHAKQHNKDLNFIRKIYLREIRKALGLK